MNPKELIRDADKVHACLEVLEDRSVRAKRAVKIYIPSRFAERGLATIGIETHIVGIYAITCEDKYYGVSLVNAMIRIEPTSTMKVTFNEDECYEFYFEPGSTVFSSIDLVKTDILVYKIFDEIASKGHVPWYVGYRELGLLLDTAKKHAGAGIGETHEVMELIASMISRNSENRHEYYRHSVQTLDELETNPPAFIGLRSVQYAATNTTNKLLGSYFDEGLVSSLVNPTERVERIESIIRR
jgi:hypothetical protein